MSQEQALEQLKRQTPRIRKRNQETDVQRACLDLLALRKITVWRVNSGVIMLGRRPVIMGHRGMSDLIGVLPGGRFLAVEVKTLGNRPSPDQRVFLSQVEAAGGAAMVVYSAAQLDFNLNGLLHTKGGESR